MSNHPGLNDTFSYPFFSALTNRRSRRVPRGVKSVPAGSLSYTSDEAAEPLTPLEEALLIAVTGVTGVTMPDMPFQSPEGKDVLGSPMLHLKGRAGSSADNAQGTHFFLINDSGTYFLKPAPETAKPLSLDQMTEQELINRVESCKVQILDKRLDFPRQFPCYIGRNRYLSNLEGSTILVPVVDLTRQYINGMMYLLSQPEGYRPTFLDDWNFYRPAGVRKWLKSGYLNRRIRIPLGYTGTFRIHIESSLLIQNLLLTIQAMGLGGWIHAAFPPPILLGDPEMVARFGPGLGFRFEEPRTSWFRRTILKLLTPLPAWRANPVGLDGILEGCCPPYFPTMDAAVDAIVTQKYGENGRYGSPDGFADIFKPGLAEKFIKEVPHVTEDAIQCTRDVCNYIYDTYGRFPAHVDAMFVPGVWVQAHHLDRKYYDELFRDGYTGQQANHDSTWHSA